VEGGERLARYSFVGFRPSTLLRAWGRHTEVEHRQGPRAGQVDIHEEDPRDVLRAIIERAPLVEADDLPRFLGGAVGFFGYDSVRLVEDIPRNNPDPLATPDINLALHDSLVAFDHLRAVMHLVRILEVDDDDDVEAMKAAAEVELAQLAKDLDAPCPAPPIGTATKPPTMRSNETPEAFAAKVARAQEYIVAGDIFQVVLSRRLTADITVDPFALYRAVRVLNPSPYLFFLEMGDHTLVGASPEMLVRVEGRRVETLPIAGTRKRGGDEAEDRALEAELRADPKECAEHEMLVDLGRNDLGRVSRFGTVKVVEHMTVHRFSHVMHMVSRVVGELREDVDALDALYATFPAGTVSGAPKVRAMEIIEELEKSARGVYAGAVGYLDYRGDLDTCIAIRTIVVAGGRAHVQAGAGIVYDSVPETEFEETANKAKALVMAIEWAEMGILT
jgi:anthranilate synthase component 1